MDFTKTPVTVRSAYIAGGSKSGTADATVFSIYEAAQKIKAKVCTVTPAEIPNSDVVDECAVPHFQKEGTVEYPECHSSELMNVVEEYQSLFGTIPGATEISHHYIPTTGATIRVPPRRIPAHYREEVEKQINTICSSPWMAPAVFVLKKSGEIRLCIDYRELNKKMLTLFPCRMRFRIV